MQRNIVIASVAAILFTVGLLLVIGLLMGVRGPAYQQIGGGWTILFDSGGVITLVKNNTGVVAYIAAVASIPIATAALVGSVAGFVWLGIRIRRQRIRESRREQFAAGGRAFPISGRGSR